ncbi:hypothetical protein OAT84_02865 [Gammaproteobacteria bacterium]|nr:hypothetical protein [Gammaproteobacteria bacterium]
MDGVIALRAVNSFAHIPVRKVGFGEYLSQTKLVMQQLFHQDQDLYDQQLALVKSQVDWFARKEMRTFHERFFQKLLTMQCEEISAEDQQVLISAINGYEALLARVLLGVPLEVLESRIGSEQAGFEVLMVQLLIEWMLLYRVPKFYPQHFMSLLGGEALTKLGFNVFGCLSWRTSVVRPIKIFIEQIYSRVLIIGKVSLFSKQSRQIEALCQQHLKEAAPHLKALSVKEVEINTHIERIYQQPPIDLGEQTPLLSTRIT